MSQVTRITEEKLQMCTKSKRPNPSKISSGRPLRKSLKGLKLDSLSGQEASFPLILLFVRRWSWSKKERKRSWRSWIFSRLSEQWERLISSRLSYLMLISWCSLRTCQNWSWRSRVERSWSRGLMKEMHISIQDRWWFRARFRGSAQLLQELNTRRTPRKSIRDCWRFSDRIWSDFLCLLFTPFFYMILVGCLYFWWWILLEIQILIFRRFYNIDNFLHIVLRYEFVSFG